jgi:hypothetical protein
MHKLQGCFIAFLLCVSLTGCTTKKHYAPLAPPMPPGLQLQQSAPLKNSSRYDTSGGVDFGWLIHERRLLPPTSTVKRRSLTGGNEGLYARLDWQANQPMEFCQAMNYSTANTNGPGPLEWSYANGFMHIDCPIESGMEIWFVITTYAPERGQQ